MSKAFESFFIEDVKERFTALPSGSSWVFSPENTKLFEAVMGSDWPMTIHAPYYRDWWAPILEELSSRPRRAYELEVLCRYRTGVFDDKTTAAILGTWRTETIMVVGLPTDLDASFCDEGEIYVLTNLTDLGAKENRVVMVTMLGMKIRPFDLEEIGVK